MRDEYVSKRKGAWYKDFVNKYEGKAVIVYDLETSGLKKDADKIIELAARKCEVVNGMLEQASSKVWYIYPGFLISSLIEDLTKITNEFLSDKPTEDQVFDEIREYFNGYPVIGYNNRKFDDAFMTEMYKRNGCEFAPEDSADCFELVNMMMLPGETVNRKLQTITEYFQLQEQIDQFHDAAGDTMATMLVFNEMMKRANADTEVRDDLIKCRVMKIARWQSPHRAKMQRIYIDTSRAKFFLDCVTKKWYLDDEHDRIQRYDVEDVISQTMAATKCSNEQELSRWKGSLFV